MQLDDICGYRVIHRKSIHCVVHVKDRFGMRTGLTSGHVAHFHTMLIASMPDPRLSASETDVTTF